MDAPHVVVVSQPAHRTGLTVHIDELDELDLIDLESVRSTRKPNLISIRTYHPLLANYQFNRHALDEAGEHLLYLDFVRKILGERYWCDLTQMVSDQLFV